MNRKVKKLVLSIETLRNLQPQELRQVKGGASFGHILVGGGAIFEKETVVICPLPDEQELVGGAVVCGSGGLAAGGLAAGGVGGSGGFAGPAGYLG